MIATPCSVNMDTKEVFDIEAVDPGNSCDILEREYIILDEVEYPVFQYSDIVEEDDEYWYE